MWNDHSCYKRIAFNAVCIFVLIFACFIYNKNNLNIAYAEDSEIENELNENIDNILNDIETDDLDVFINDDFSLDYFSIDSFKDFVYKILSGEIFIEYDSLFNYISSSFMDVFKKIFSFVLTIFVIIVLYEIFVNLCVDKYLDFKKNIKFIFSIAIVITLLSLVKNVGDSLTEIINNIFSFSSVLFPLLLSLILSSGATGSFAVYSSLSAFVLNSGLYVFVYILLPLSISILILSIFSAVIGLDKFSKFINLLKYVFKLIISILFTVFGLFSILNVATSGMKDGLSLKITKYAIQNYIPILGGYISQGFDFIKTCSVLVKNAVGICGIFLLFFIVVKPLIIYLVYIFAFKILAFLTSYIGNDSYSNIFEHVSKGFSFLLAVLIGVFLIMFIFIYLLIISVSVV